MAASSGSSLPRYEYSQRSEVARIKYNRRRKVGEAGRLEVYDAAWHCEGEENVFDYAWFDLGGKMNLARPLYPRQTC
jgi:hypothetical protein